MRSVGIGHEVSEGQGGGVYQSLNAKRTSSQKSHVVFKFLVILRLNNGLNFLLAQEKGSLRWSRDIFSALTVMTL